MELGTMELDPLWLDICFRKTAKKPQIKAARSVITTLSKMSRCPQCNQLADTELRALAHRIRRNTVICRNAATTWLYGTPMCRCYFIHLCLICSKTIWTIMTRITSWHIQWTFLRSFNQLKQLLWTKCTVPKPCQKMCAHTLMPLVQWQHWQFGTLPIILKQLL